MSRKIKFRVWDKDYECMHTCGENSHDSAWFDENNNFRYHNLQNGDGSGEGGAYELMEYTGERDIGGKEIYEGDIIEFNDVEYSDSPSQKFTVRSGEDFHRDCCYLQNINEYIDQYIKDNGEYPDDSIQVIGNIYDNPGLIKECEW